MTDNCKATRGASWCSCFGYWILDLCKVQYPQQKSALARSHKNKYSFNVLEVLNNRKVIRAGDGLIWQKGESIYGHFGFAMFDWEGRAGYSIEGNTSADNTGSQSNGDGVYVKKRKIEPFNYFRIKWITPYSDVTKFKRDAI